MMTVKGISKWYFRHRYSILFYSLLTTIAFEPIVSTLVEHSPLTRGLLGVNLIIAVLSSMTGAVRRILVTVALIIWVAQLPFGWVTDPDIAMVRYLGWTIVAAMSAGSAVYYAIRARRIDSQHLYAALSAYLIAGLIFGAIHHMIEMAIPGSYSTGGVALEGMLRIEDAIYFSFVTLATLGYGDILPRLEAARGIAMLEAVAGQLYLAVMIARIVSLYVPKRIVGDVPDPEERD